MLLVLCSLYCFREPTELWEPAMYYTQYRERGNMGRTVLSLGFKHKQRCWHQAKSITVNGGGAKSRMETSVARNSRLLYIYMYLTVKSLWMWVRGQWHKCYGSDSDMSILLLLWEQIWKTYIHVNNGLWIWQLQLHQLSTSTWYCMRLVSFPGQHGTGNKASPL